MDGKSRASTADRLRAASSPWLTAEGAADRAGVGMKLIYREVNASRLRACRVGGRRQLRFRAEWIDQWLESTAE